ncbi:GTPase-activating Rap/Ran-GAP domain-like protein 3 isoform X3 [Parasteatoda tepidariorum]|uniref:GTPase-activating Rap/Ran-GAP domain-like protein 3 isoform X3 n=2 Tax=Parasteatoda tepidariorum TaxID=114398 RepID=UPI00077FE36E|nr:GTPase-activating Rap/Ran-GAP domain-like protein 3 isoform X1 [Parasteatoda tepidariorum]
MPLKHGQHPNPQIANFKGSFPKRDRSRSLCVDRATPLLPKWEAKASPPFLGRRGSSSGIVGIFHTTNMLLWCHPATLAECESPSSSTTDLAARRGVFSRRRYGSVEMLASCDSEGSESLVRRFRVENGEQVEKDEVYGSPSTPVLENPEYQTRWYFKFFLGKLHQNYVGADAEKIPFFLSVVLTDANSQGVQQYRAILWRKTGAQKICLSHSPGKPLTVKSILSNFQNMDKIEKGPKEIFSPEIQKDLLLLEEQEGSVNFKFGVLFAKARQTTDDEMFSNEVGTKDFDKFVCLLGEKIRLKSWDKYRGGLDVKGDMTGKYSAYTIYEGHEIMFHVSTLLPYSKDNRQQVERKRHIGNDIVNIIFLEGSHVDHINFKPTMIKSQFTHIFAVVSYEREEDSYRLSVYSEESVPLFGPTLPNPPIFKNHQEFREFLLVKLINGEKAAFNTPTFAQKRERTLDMLIKDLYTEHMAENRGTMLNRRAFSDVLSDASKTSRRKEEARQVEFVRIGQALKLDTIVKGDAPTSLATTSLFKREPWEPQCFYPDFPHEIVCGDSWGDNRLVLATEDGTFVVEEGASHRLIFDKSVQVKQLSVVEAHGILLIRADKGRDSRIHVFRLSDFEGEQNESLVRTKSDIRDHKIERSKGCHLYALSRPGGSHLRMAVALGRKLVILQWRHSAAWTTWCAASDTDTVDGFQFTKEISLSDTPQLITLVDSPVTGFDNQICVGYRHQFDLVNEKTGEIQRLHVIEGNKGNLIAAIDVYEDDEAELLLCYNHMTHFQKLFEEGTSEFDFQWNAVPEAIVCAFPYVMAFTSDNIEIRLVINGNLVQSMVMPSLRLITAKSDIIFATTAPESFQVRRERVKVDKMDRDPSLSPPPSPHSMGGYAPYPFDGVKPFRIFRISYTSLTGSSPSERRVPTPSTPTTNSMLNATSSGLTYLTPDAQVDHHSGESNRLRAEAAARPSRSASSSPLPQLPFHRQPSPTRGLNRDHIHSASSDSGLGKSLGSTPPPSPFVVAEQDPAAFQEK